MSGWRGRENKRKETRKERTLHQMSEHFEPISLKMIVGKVENLSFHFPAQQHEIAHILKVRCRYPE